MTSLLDRVLATALVALVLGSVVCFGGAVWWFRPAALFLALLLAGAKLAQFLIGGRVPFLKSPLGLLALLALALGVLQLVPLPPALARRVSPAAQEIYAYGTIPRLVHSDDPAARLPEPAVIRSPASLDRAATLRWLVGAVACLAIFWSVSHFADRLGRLYLVWGCVVGAFLVNGAFALVQLTCGAEGLFGFLHPGRGPIWAPSLDDLFETPTAAVLRRLEDAAATPGAGPERIALVPEQPFLFGTMLGGERAFLALASLALPLALALVIHLISPRGSRESLSTRLSHAAQGSLVVLLLFLLVASAFLAGSMAGTWFSLPFALGLAAVGLPSAVATHARWPALGLTVLVLVSLALGAILVAAWPFVATGAPPFDTIAWQPVKRLWAESLPIAREFPWVGTGFGSFATIYPYFKAEDASSTTAMSSLLQCGLESGAFGLLILGLAVLWCLCRLPFCLKHVGSADRTLAYGLIGAALCFGSWSVVHWTVELPAVAISVSALGGTWNRWLAGGTDLFTQRG